MSAEPLPFRADFSKLWIDWAWYGKRMRWSATIWHTESPWGIAASSPDFRMKWRAVRWARRWLAGKTVDFQGRQISPRA